MITPDHDPARREDPLVHFLKFVGVALASFACITLCALGGTLLLRDRFVGCLLGLLIGVGVSAAAIRSGVWFARPSKATSLAPLKRRLHLSSWLGLLVLGYALIPIVFAVVTIRPGLGLVLAPFIIVVSIALIHDKRSRGPLLVGLVAMPLASVLAWIATTSPHRESRRAEAEQMLGSLKGQARVAYAKRGLIPQTLTGPFDQGGSEVWPEELQGRHFRVLDQVLSIEGKGKLIATPLAGNESEGVCVVTFNWGGGDGTFTWSGGSD